MRRSSSVNETKEGVVKLPCSFATARHVSPRAKDHDRGPGHTDFNIRSFIVRHARIGSACVVPSASSLPKAVRESVTKVNANGPLVNLVRHVCVE